MRYHLICSAAAVCLCVMCGGNRNLWNTDLLYADDNFTAERMPRGNQAVILPLIIDSVFATSEELSSNRLIKRLDKTNKGIELIDAGVLSEHLEKETEEEFYAALLKDSVISLMNRDSLWESIPYRFIVVSRVLSGLRIKTFEDVTAREARILTEIWDTDKGAVAWRAEGTGFERDFQGSDTDFLCEGLVEVFSKLPNFYFSVDEKEW